MLNFNIQYRKTGEVSIEAETREEALKIFQKIASDKTPTFVFEDGKEEEGSELIGICESSGKYIFEGDEYSTDPEGNYYLVSELDENSKGKAVKYIGAAYPEFIMKEVIAFSTYDPKIFSLMTEELDEIGDAKRDDILFPDELTK